MVIYGCWGRESQFFLRMLHSIHEPHSIEGLQISAQIICTWRVNEKRTHIEWINNTSEQVSWSGVLGQNKLNSMGFFSVLFWHFLFPMLGCFFLFYYFLFIAHFDFNLDGWVFFLGCCFLFCLLVSVACGWTGALCSSWGLDFWLLAWQLLEQEFSAWVGFWDTMMRRGGGIGIVLGVQGEVYLAACLKFWQPVWPMVQYRVSA